MSQLWKAFNTLPIFTRCILGSAIIVPILGRLINPYLLLLDYKSVFRFELWRLYTSVFFTGLSFNWLFDMFFIYQQSLFLEKQMQKKDYFFFLAFVWINLLGIAYIQGMYVLFRPFISALIYQWSRFNQDTTVTFYFGIQFKGQYLPWVYVLMEYLTPAPNPVPPLIGILVSHGYYYATTKELITTPKVFETIYNKYLYPAEPVEGPHVASVNAGRPSSGPGQPAARPHTWGRGNRLG